MKPIHGVVPIIPIPFHEDETIDEVSFRRTIDFVASLGVAGMCLPAYGSEYYKLTEAEREWLIATAVEVAAGRIPVVAQANHGSSRVAAQLARGYEALGADVISFALPRQFVMTDVDLLRYAGRIADAVSLPILVQDFNPGGATIGGEFIANLHRQHPNFSYAKLEEPLIIDKLTAIRDRMGKAIGIFEGWGGYYMLEALPTGVCCGVMPGVPIADLLNRVYRLHEHGDIGAAYTLFGSLLPFINFTLQNFELFLQVEKQLMVRRGLFESSICRAPSRTLSPAVDMHVQLLLDQIVQIGLREELAGYRSAASTIPPPHVRSQLSDGQLRT